MITSAPFDNWWHEAYGLDVKIVSPPHTLLAMGFLFQVPVGIVAVTRAGFITPRRLRQNRRYAVLACGLVAAVLPGDAITLLLETVPLYLLFEVGVLIASLLERRAGSRAATDH